MWRAAKFCVVAVIVLAVAWAVASLPGTVTAQSAGLTLTTSTPMAVLLIALVVLLLIILLRVLGGIRRAPRGFAQWRGGRRSQEGEVAVQRGLVALAAGDAPATRQAAAQARKRLGETPLVTLLEAEAARLAGEAEAAKAGFERLTRHKEMRFLGHQGLLRQALETGTPEAASAQAMAAEAAYPGASWTRQQRLTLALRQHDFTAALGLTQDRQERAALAAAAAASAPTPKAALALAKQAVQAAPDFPPAVAALATALRAVGKENAARKTVLHAWQRAPHPLLAAAFLPQAPALARAQAAAQLAAANPGHVESELVLGETALAANLPGEAKRHAEAALAAGNADGRARAILNQLAGLPVAAPAPAWRCRACNVPQITWQAICPACGKPGTLQADAPGAMKADTPGTILA